MNINKNIFKQASLFGLVGIITLIVDVVSTSMFYNYLGFTAFIASCLGFAIGFLVSFPLNRKKVFNHSLEDRFSLHTQAFLFIFLSIINLFFSGFVVQFFVSEDIVPIELAKISVTFLIAIWNFLIFKLFIFSKKNK